MPFAKQNPKLPEGINSSEANPLVEFLWLLAAIVVILVVVISLAVFSARALSPYIPFHYEEKLVDRLGGNAFIGQREQQLSAAAQAATRSLQTLGGALAQRADLPDGMTLKFHFLVSEDQPNAFATIGGHIFVTAGLVKSVSSENALAMVLAHEIAHVKRRHPAQALSSGLVVQLFLGAFLGGDQGALLRGLLGQTGHMTLLSFSRSMEAEADTEALATLQSYYGHPGGADEFFGKMLEAGHQSGWREMFDTHPDVAKRYEKMEKAITAACAQACPLQPLDVRLQGKF